METNDDNNTMSQHVTKDCKWTEQRSSLAKNWVEFWGLNRHDVEKGPWVHRKHRRVILWSKIYSINNLCTGCLKRCNDISGSHTSVASAAQI